MEEQPIPDETSQVALQQKSVAPPVLTYALIAFILILLGVIGLLVLNMRRSPTEPVISTTMQSPTPTLSQPLSSIATQSAFVDFAASVTNLSDTLSEATILDQVLSPPALTLPLGF